MVRFSALGRSVLALAAEAHPVPWRCEGARVLDARGTEVLRIEGNPAGAALAVEVVQGVFLEAVNGGKRK